MERLGWFSWTAAGLAMLLAAGSVLAGGPLRIDEEGIRARMVGTTLHLKVPVENLTRKALRGELAAEVLGVYDDVLGEAKRHVILDWREGIYSLKFRVKAKKEELELCRLRYRLVAEESEVEGVLGLPSILRAMDVYLMGQSELISGAPASVRVVTLERATHEPLKGTRVSIKLVSEKRTLRIFTGRTNGLGTIDAAFYVPRWVEGDYDLVVEARSSLGEKTIERSVKIARRDKVLLVTDKPIYQPSQTIHLRALALAKPELDPVSDAQLILEVEDPRGNKVFKKSLKTNEFGLAFSQFNLADEINLGTYKVRAVLGETKTEKTVRVERYVLPKFKVGLSTNRDYYLPGETMRGELEAYYFFGKPVSGGEVELVLEKFDVGFSEIGRITGRTDKSGHFEFSYDLPTYFVGQPLEQGDAFVKITVEVRDKADHSEEMTQTRPIAGDPVRILVVPESGELVPSLENHIQVMTTYPDGSPAETEVTLTFEGESQTKRANRIGITTFKILPSGRQTRVRVTAADDRGNSGEIEKVFSYGVQEQQILVRPDRALYKVGDQMKISIFATKKGPVYLDIVKDRQTMLTKSVWMEGGRAAVTIDLGADNSGTLTVQAYMITSTSNIVRDRRVVYVYPASDLTISVHPDKETYLPGENGLIKFLVEDGQGRPTLAALGISIVDEAVFALQEIQPGLERVYFTLEKELMEPRYEIHGFTPFEITKLEPPKPREEDVKEDAARFLFASAGASPAHPLQVNPKEERALAEWALTSTYSTRITADAQDVGGLLLEYHKRVGGYPEAAVLEELRRRELIGERELLDPWGQEYEASFGLQRRWGNLTLRSGGPDKTLNTSDDLTGYARLDLNRKVVIGKQRYSKVLRITTLKRRAETGQTSGKVVDALTGKGLPFANVLLRGTRWGAVTDLEGLFQIINIPPGKYVLEARIMGYQPEVLRDLEVGAGSETEVEFGLAPVAMPELEGQRVFGERMLALDAVAEMAGGFEAEFGAAEKKAAAPPSATAVAPPEEPRIRRYFPETLLFEPSLITDERGRATLPIKWADSITKWRLITSASSKKGLLGSRTDGVTVFQDFFVDIDLPVSLTQNDIVSIPVAVYNYLQNPQKVRIELQTRPWFELLDDASREKVLEPNEVSVVYFRVKAAAIGHHSFTVKAYGEHMSDAIERKIEVIPDGKEFLSSVSDRLSQKVEKAVFVPPEAINDASKIWVKIHPGVTSQIVEGMDSMLRMPFGCFEQTSAVTYPNVLILDYMRSTQQISPEIEMKAEEYINVGYQRLLSYEVKGGGFEWFGNEPANRLLTAFGLMEFKDMSEVYEVDPDVLTRTQRWLLSKQEDDGSWSPDERYLHMETWRRLKNTNLLVTAYLTWALLESGFEGDRVERGVRYLNEHLDQAEEPYSLALCANALTSFDPKLREVRTVLDKLMEKKVEENGAVYWKSEVASVTFSRGKGADIETTSLVAYALIRSGIHTEIANKALTFLIRSKDPHGTWGSTQGTILALKALLASLRGSREDTDCRVTIKVNGKEAETLRITREDAEVMRIVDLKEYTVEGQNSVELSLKGEGSPLYEICSRYYLPWVGEPAPKEELLSIAVEYDRTELTANDLVTCSVKVSNNRPGTADMVIVDLGIPPGFEVQTPDLDEFVGVKFEKYNLTGRQIILYLDKVVSGKPVEFSFRLRAKFPLRAKTRTSRVYEYYNPDVETVIAPVELAVK